MKKSSYFRLFPFPESQFPLSASYSIKLRLLSSLLSSVFSTEKPALPKINVILHWTSTRKNSFFLKKNTSRLTIQLVVSESIVGCWMLLLWWWGLCGCSFYWADEQLSSQIPSVWTSSAKKIELFWKLYISNLPEVPCQFRVYFANGSNIN